jgi:hypothetical protein
MIKVISSLLTIIFVTTMALAQQAEVMTVKGYIIDNMCAHSQSPEQLDEFVKVHTKECALAPQCMASGYSIYADHKLMKFDKPSNAKVAEFLNNPDSKLLVTAEVKKAGEELELISIKNE